MPLSTGCPGTYSKQNVLKRYRPAQAIRFERIRLVHNILRRIQQFKDTLRRRHRFEEQIVSIRQRANRTEQPLRPLNKRDKGSNLDGPLAGHLIPENGRPVIKNDQGQREGAPKLDKRKIQRVIANLPEPLVPMIGVPRSIGFVRCVFAPEQLHHAHTADDLLHIRVQPGDLPAYFQVRQARVFPKHETGCKHERHGNKHDQG